MNLLICLLASLFSLSAESITKGDCTLENFVGTWKGKVEYEGDELAQGPYEFVVGEDGETLHMTDETGAEFELTVDNCEATNIVEEEGINMKTTYTFEEGALQVLSVIAFPDADGKLIETEMRGSMAKVE